MSSATTAAKRRRAGNIVSTPLFKPTSAAMENSVQRRANMAQNSIPRQQPIQQQPTQQTSQSPETINGQVNTQRPMSLQQVISVFDKRLLHIEGHILKNGGLNSEPSQVNNAVVTKDMESLKESIRENLDGQFSEFDHRYQLLANEIANLKQIVLKLQSYSLEINKSLMDERSEILSKLNNVQEKVEETIDASTNTMEEENINFDISSSDVKQEFIENANDISEEVVEEQIAEPKEDGNVIEAVVEETIEQIANSEEQEEEDEDDKEEKQEEVVEEQIAEPKEIDDVVEEQEKSKQKKKRKNKNIVTVSV
jgi:hypothetical protein